MSSLLFLLRRTLKSLVKSIFKKPAVLIGYILVAIFLGAMIVLSFVMPSGLVRQSSSELFRGIMMIVFIFLYYTTLKLGIEKGSSYFRAADVNLIFTAPISPNKVLLYGFIKQIAGTFALLFIAIFQIPNLKNNFVMMPYGVPMLMLSVVAYAMAYPLMGMVIYSFTSKSKKRKLVVKRIFDGCAIAIALVFLFNLMTTGDLQKTIIDVFDNPIAQYFPIFGWTSAIASSAVSGFTLPFIIGASGMVILIVGSSIALYKMNLDYYEDVLEATDFLEQAYKAKKEGRNLTFNQKVKQNVKHKMTGDGARAIFQKMLLELKKTSIFLFFDKLSVTVILSGIAFSYLMPDEVGMSPFLLVLSFSVYMLMLMQVQGGWSNELSKHYIFLVPASSPQKLLYATMTEHIKNLFDGILLFVISGVLFKGSVDIILACIMTYVAFGAVFTYTDVLTRKLFGSVHSKGLQIFIKVIACILVEVPGIIFAVLAGILTHSDLLAILALGGWSLILAITFFMLSANIFKNLESAA